MRGKFHRTFVILAVLFQQICPARADTYILRQPIQQTTELTRKWALTSLGVDLTISAAKAGTIYYLTGSTQAAGTVAINDAIFEIPMMAASPRAQLNAWAAWKRREHVKKIANIPGVEKIRVITAGRVENHSYLTATLHSQSVVFIETQGALPSELGTLEDWRKLDDLESSRLHLQLKIADQPAGSPIEVSLSDLFGKKALAPEGREEWLNEIANWKQDFSAWQKLNLIKPIDNALSIETDLLVKDEKLKIGELTSGKGVQKTLRNSAPQKLIDWVRSSILNSKGHGTMKLTQKTITVRKKGESKPNCKEIVKQILGNLYFRE